MAHEYGNHEGEYVDLTKDLSNKNFYTGSFAPSKGGNKRLNFYSVRHLYYSNYDTGSGYVDHSGSFYNYEESSFAPGTRTMDPTSGSGMVFSIPRKLFDTKIQPNSIKVSSSNSSYNLTDDGEGSLLRGSSHVGNVIYSHGQIIVTNRATFAHYSASLANTGSDQPFICFKSTVPVYTYNYSLKVSDYEFNHTLNPSAQKNNSIFYYTGSNSDSSGSKFLRPSGVYADNITGSEFQPYITSVGLYNGSNELIAVGKLPQALQKPKDTELTINLTLDI